MMEYFFKPFVKVPKNLHCKLVLISGTWNLFPKLNQSKGSCFTISKSILKFKKWLVIVSNAVESGNKTVFKYF